MDAPRFATRTRHKEKSRQERMSTYPSEAALVVMEDAFRKHIAAVMVVTQLQMAVDRSELRRQQVASQNLAFSFLPVRRSLDHTSCRPRTTQRTTSSACCTSSSRRCTTHLMALMAA